MPLRRQSLTKLLYFRYANADVRQAALLHKTALFNHFFARAKENLRGFENAFQIHGVVAQVFSDEPSDSAARARLHASPAWRQLLALIDYAFEGVLGPADAESILCHGCAVLRHAINDLGDFSSPWYAVVLTADARFGFDLGVDLDVHRVAALARVDVSKVLAAAASGALRTLIDDGVEMVVEHGSVRYWLHGQPGFRPTARSALSGIFPIADIASRDDFARFLQLRRMQLELYNDADFLSRYPGIASAGFELLESGLFRLPLDAVFPIADYYEVERGAFLACVMRVFFADEYAALRRIEPRP